MMRLFPWVSVFLEDVLFALTMGAERMWGRRVHVKMIHRTSTHRNSENQRFSAGDAGVSRRHAGSKRAVPPHTFHSHAQGKAWTGLRQIHKRASGGIDVNQRHGRGLLRLR
jgi:hypothetical protein